MSEWKKVKLKDICEITSSKRIFFSEYVDIGIPFYRSKEIIELSNGQSISEPLFISETKYNDIRMKFGVPKENDILLTSVGSIGIPYIVKKDDVFYFKDGNLTWLRNFKDFVFPTYLLYWLKSDETFNILNNIALGAAQKALTIVKLKDVEISLPPITTQYCIANILSRYDSLIENYQKQIKLLEEAAQRLYKEWFVDLHFPGYENTKIVDGVPEGWEKKRLIDIAKLKAGGDKPEVFSKVKTSELKVPIFSNGTIDDGLYGYTDIAEINDQCVTISARGSVGYTVLRLKPFVPIVRLISVIPSNIYVGYLYFFIKGMPIESNGAAQQQITVPMIKNKEVIIPPDIILDSFKEKEESYFRAIENYKEQILSLSEARDRLLPKLMSGEMAV